MSLNELNILNGLIEPKLLNLPWISAMDYPIDQTSTFIAERIVQIAENMGINEPDEILRKIYLCKIFNSGHVELREINRRVPS